MTSPEHTIQQNTQAAQEADSNKNKQLAKTQNNHYLPSQLWFQVGCELSGFIQLVHDVGFLVVQSQPEPYNQNIKHKIPPNRIQQI